MIKKIESVNNTFIKDLVKLKDTKNIKESKKFLVEGWHLVNEAKDYLECILVKEEQDNFSVDQYIVTGDILKKISNNKSVPEIIGVCKFKEEKLITSNEIIFLNAVQDPGNVGTIFRSALAFNFFDILVDDSCAFKYSPKVVQSSQGSIFKLNILIANIDTIKFLKRENYKIICTTLSPNSEKLSEFCRVFDKYCVIFGNEGNGISKEILELSDLNLIIDINNIDSLNVGISAGIIMYNFKYGQKK